VSEESEQQTYRGTEQCEVCGAYFEVVWENKRESVAASCPECGTHYPELYL
jgi:uncharacterized Zn finger protein